MNAGRIALKSQVLVVRLLSRIMPERFGRIGAKTFLTPRRVPHRRMWEHAFEGASRHEIVVDSLRVPVWIQGTGPAVLLVHGWERDHVAMGAFVGPLISAGFSVIAMDLPAHGEAEGERAPLPLMAKAISIVAATYGQPEAVIAHSVGGAMTALSIEEYALAPSKVVLLGAPVGAADYAMSQGARSGLAPVAIAKMIEAISAELEAPLSRFRVDLALREFRVNGLLIHDENDAIVPLTDARTNARHGGLPLKLVNAGGHNRMLGDQAVIDASLEFLSGADAGATNLSRLSSVRA